MTTQSFVDLIVWQRGKNLTIEVYKAFQDCKDFSFKDQVQRAALSIPNNIAEGYARRSDKAFKNFLYIAKGSAAEVESMLYIALELRYIDLPIQDRLINQTHEVLKLLSAFMKKL